MSKLQGMGGQAPRKVNRVVTQIGDSSDGSGQEEKEWGFKNDLDKYQKGLKLSDIGSSPYPASFILTDIGNRLLQTTEVREGYKKVKDPLSLRIRHIDTSLSELKPDSKTYQNLESEKKELEKLKERRDELDKKLGKGWALFVQSMDPNNFNLTHEASDYYLKTNKIDALYRDSDEYRSKNSKDKVLFHFKKEGINIKDIKDIYDLNLKIDEVSKKNRKEGSYKLSAEKDASAFLADLKVQKKLDRDIGKSNIYDYRYGSKKFIDEINIGHFTVQEDQTLKISKGGAFSHLITNEGSYETIANRLKEWSEGKDPKLNKKDLKKFFQSSLTGRPTSDFILDKSNEPAIKKTLDSDFKLLFNLEPRRSPSALLTNAMCIDLIDKGVYSIEEFANKSPMAMKGAVSASYSLEEKDKERFSARSKYDYRQEVASQAEIKELHDRNNNILFDWLIYGNKELRKEIEETIRSIRNAKDETIKEFKEKNSNLSINFYESAQFKKLYGDDKKIEACENIIVEYGNFKIKLNGKALTSPLPKLQNAYVVTDLQYLRSVLRQEDLPKNVLKVSDGKNPKLRETPFKDLTIKDKIVIVDEEKVKKILVADKSIDLRVAKEGHNPKNGDDFKEDEGKSGAEYLKGRIISSGVQILSFPISKFGDLVKDWYGIEVPYLQTKGRTEFTLKAAAEPKDPDIDRRDPDDQKEPVEKKNKEYKMDEEYEEKLDSIDSGTTSTTDSIKKQKPGFETNLKRLRRLTDWAQKSVGEVYGKKAKKSDFAVNLEKVKNSLNAKDAMDLEEIKDNLKSNLKLPTVIGQKKKKITAKRTGAKISL